MERQETPAVESFVEGLRLKDWERLATAFDPKLRFRALVPGELVDVGSAAEVVAAYRRWMDDKQDVELVSSESETLVDRVRFRYRLRLTKKGDPYVVEQELCGDLEAGRFVALDVLCSGFRPLGVAAHGAGLHRFDAGDLGCGTGLPREFRTRLLQIPVGHRLEVVTGDASAREDLPSLARMLGHRVLEIESLPDGKIMIRVERAK